MASLNHIGIAVQSLPAMQKLLGLLGLQIDHSELVPDQGVKTHFFPLPEVQVNLELLEPVNSEGTVAQFIAKRGPGIHHLSFLLGPGELEPLCRKLQAESYRLIYDQPRKGAHGMRINFIHPQSAGGILIELMEAQCKSD